MGRDIDQSVRRHFHFPSEGSTPTRFPRVRCKYCNKTFAFTVPRGREHLTQCGQFKEPSKGPVQSPGPMDSYAFKMNDSQVNNLQYLAARAIFTSGRPFRTFEHEDFRTFFNALNPAFKVPSPPMIAALLPKVYNEYKAKVIEKLNAAEYLNIVFDGSENVRSERVFNVCVAVPYGPAYYWKTIDAGEITLSV
jgi:hypothetical protein